MTELNPLDVILLCAIGVGAVAVWKFMLKESRNSTTATNNSTSATNNNTSMMTQVNETMKESVEVMKENVGVMRELKDEVASNVKKATKKQR